MKFRAFLLSLCAVWVITPCTSAAQQWPGPLVEQMKRVITLYGDASASEDTDGRMIQQVERAPGDDIVLIIFQVKGMQAMPRHWQVLAVFVPEKDERGAQHFRLIDFIRVAELGRRTIETLDAKVTHNKKSGETIIALAALEGVNSAENLPGRKTTIRLQLKNDRLLEEKRRPGKR